MLWITCHAARDGGRVQLNVAEIGAFAIASDATRVFIQTEGVVTTIDVRETPEEIAALIGEVERCAGLPHSALPAIRRDLQ